MPRIYFRFCEKTFIIAFISSEPRRPSFSQCGTGNYRSDAGPGGQARTTNRIARLYLYVFLAFSQKIFQSPTDIRLQLLEPERYPYLFKCLYGILMLLPQSSAFVSLRNRLNAVTGFLQIAPKTYVYIPVHKQTFPLT